MNSVFEMLLMAIMYVFFIALMIFHAVSYTHLTLPTILLV